MPIVKHVKKSPKAKKVAKKTAPKKVAKKATKITKTKTAKVHTTAKRGMKFSGMGLKNGGAEYNFEKDVVDKDPNLKPMLLEIEPGEHGEKYAAYTRFDTNKDLAIMEQLSLYPDEFDAKFPTNESLAEWEAVLKKEPKRVLSISPMDQAEEQIAHEFSATEINHNGPAAIQYNIFNEDTQFPVSKRLIGPPGTMEEPTMVFSPKPYRTVGCVGTVDNPHPLHWFSMEGYLKHMCPSCGQIFQLTNDPDDCDFSYVDKVDNMSHFTGSH